jgi:hypothetical protein
MLHHLGKAYDRSPSSWLLTKENLSVAEQAFALDLDAACLHLAADNEEQIAASKDHKTIKRVMGRG